MTLDQIGKILIVYGPLGVMCFIALMVAWQKDKDLKTERQEYQKKLEEMAKAHQAEMNVLEERYITKAENWMNKYHELATVLAELETGFEKVVDRFESLPRIMEKLESLLARRQQK